MTKRLLVFVAATTVLAALAGAARADDPNCGNWKVLLAAEQERRAEEKSRIQTLTDEIPAKAKRHEELGKKYLKLSDEADALVGKENSGSEPQVMAALLEAESAYKDVRVAAFALFVSQKLLERSETKISALQLAIDFNCGQKPVAQAPPIQQQATPPAPPLASQPSASPPPSFQPPVPPLTAAIPPPVYPPAAILQPAAPPLAAATIPPPAASTKGAPASPPPAAPPPLKPAQPPAASPPSPAKSAPPPAAAPQPPKPAPPQTAAAPPPVPPPAPNRATFKLYGIVAARCERTASGGLMERVPVEVNVENGKATGVFFAKGKNLPTAGTIDAGGKIVMNVPAAPELNYSASVYRSPADGIWRGTGQFANPTPELMRCYINSIALSQTPSSIQAPK